MVLRLWIEPGAGIRVRVTQTTDVESGQSTTSYASTIPEGIALVQTWLDETASLLRGADDADKKRVQDEEDRGEGRRDSNRRGRP
jgi:hypothetical protein